MTFNFIAGSWDGVNGATYSETEVIDGTPVVSKVTIDVRSGITVSSSDVELGPLVLKGPYFNVEELQLKPPEEGNPASQWSLVSSVALGVDSASLKFGGSTSDKVKTSITSLLGTFNIDSVISANGDARSSPGKFLISVGKAELEIKDIVKAEASGVYISYDPLIDKNFDGTISADEQTAYDTQEMLRVDDAQVEIPKFGLTGTVRQYTRPLEAIDPRTGLPIGGTTVPGLTVPPDGFRLGEASLTKAGKFQFGADEGDTDPDKKGMVELTNLTAGIQDVYVTFLPSLSVDIDGSFFVAAGEAVLFPGKKFEMQLTDGSDSDTEAVRAALKFTDNVPTGFAIKVDTGDLKFGKALKVHTENFILDTTATGINPVVGFDALSATVAAGPLALSGEIRNFGLLRDGSIQTRAGFGVFFGAESLDSKKLKWPEWLPIRPTEVGIQRRNINANPADFRLIVSADVTGIKGLPLQVSGTIRGLEFDVGAAPRREPADRPAVDGSHCLGQSVWRRGHRRLDWRRDPHLLVRQRGPGHRFRHPHRRSRLLRRHHGRFRDCQERRLHDPHGADGERPAGRAAHRRDGGSGDPAGADFGLEVDRLLGRRRVLQVPARRQPPGGPARSELRPGASNSSPIDAGQWEAQVRSQTIAQYKAIKEGGQAGDFLAAFRSPILISAGARSSSTRRPTSSRPTPRCGSRSTPT